jgi:hypothetical protein
MFRKSVCVAVITSFSSMIMGGCATKGDNVSAAYVPASIYSTYNCQQIAQELMTVGVKAAELSGQMDEAAGKDTALVAVGLVLFWPALFFVGGDKGKEAQLAQLKGQRDTLMSASNAKGCNLNDMKPAVNKEMASAPQETAPGTPVLSVADVEKKVDLLNELRAKGIITEDEYKTKRAQVIEAAMVPANKATPSSPPNGQQTAPAVAPTSGLRAGDKLTYQETEPRSGVKGGEVVYVIDSVTQDRVSMSGGAVVLGIDGSPSKGQMNASYIYGYRPDGLSTRGKFRVNGVKDDVDVTLSLVAVGDFNVDGRTIKIANYRISGFSSRQGGSPGGNAGGASFGGSPISGELLVENSSGILVKMRTKSADPRYDIDAKLISVTR